MNHRFINYYFQSFKKVGEKEQKIHLLRRLIDFFFRVNVVGYYYYIFVAFIIITKYTDTQAINKQENFWKETDVVDNFMFSYIIK